MGSVRSRVLLGMVVAVVVASVPGIRSARAQPSPGSSVPTGANTRVTAKKLVDDGIAAFNVKDYGKAISFYMRAFVLEPRPRLLFNVGQALRLAGCTERAVSFYARYLALEPQGGESEAARGILAEIKGRRPSGSTGKNASKSSEACSVADGLVEAQSAAPFEIRGRLKLHSSLEGMTVMLDGVKIGTTPIEHEVAAGAHMISLVHRERLVGEQRVEIGANAVVEVTIPVVLPKTPSRAGSYALFGGAGVALAVGGYIFYLGQKGGPGHPYDQFRYPYANYTGIAFVGVGAAAIGVGIWLWSRQSREQESAPVAAISSSGSYFGWQGKF